MSGKNLIYGAIVMLAALSFVNPACAGQGGGGGPGGGGGGGRGGRGGPPPGGGGGDQQNGDNGNKPPKPPRGPELIGFILDHKTDLSLTDDQVAALQALQKNGPPPPKDGDAKPPKDGAKGGPPPPRDGQRPPKDGPPPPVMEAIKQILTPAQMDMLKDLLDKNKPPKPDRKQN